MRSFSQDERSSSSHCCWGRPVAGRQRGRRHSHALEQPKGPGGKRALGRPVLLRDRALWPGHLPTTPGVSGLELERGVQGCGERCAPRPLPGPFLSDTGERALGQQSPKFLSWESLWLLEPLQPLCVYTVQGSRRTLLQASAGPPCPPSGFSAAKEGGKYPPTPQGKGSPSVSGGPAGAQLSR